MPISILNFPRAWQPQFLSHTLQILIKCVFFIDKQMMLTSSFYIFYRIPTIFKKLGFSLTMASLETVLLKIHALPKFEGSELKKGLPRPSQF